MFHLDNGTGVDTMPMIANEQSSKTKWFTEGDNSNAPSYPGQDWFNMAQAEFLNVLKLLNVTPDKTKLNQIASVINQLSNGNADAAAEAKKIAETAQNTANSSLIIGEIRLLPFRVSELPKGWYFANGDAYELSTDIGKALKSLSANFKTDWGIVTTTATISLPNMFYSDGRGYFFRAVDGISRQVGTVQQDKFETHEHGWSGVRDKWASNGSGGITFFSGTSQGQVEFKITSPISGKFGDETNPINVGMIPAIYLGV